MSKKNPCARCGKSAVLTSYPVTEGGGLPTSKAFCGDCFKVVKREEEKSR